MIVVSDMVLKFIWKVLNRLQPITTLRFLTTRMLGQPFGDYYAFCISTPKGQSYIKESITKLFTLIPDLAGLITISVGESVASCAGAEVGEWSCPNCQALGLSRAEALAKCEKLMAEALREVKPDAELISWTYTLRSWDEKDVEYCKSVLLKL